MKVKYQFASLVQMTVKKPDEDYLNKAVIAVKSSIPFESVVIDYAICHIVYACTVTQQSNHLTSSEETD